MTWTPASRSPPTSIANRPSGTAVEKNVALPTAYAATDAGVTIQNRFQA